MLTIREYIESVDSLDLKIAAIESLIDAMLLNAIDSISDSGTKIYSLDDGQSKIMTEFRSPSDITKGVLALEKMKFVYVNRRDGSGITILRGRLNN
ncbi:structural protein [Cellulophaga phage phi47:1]|uniref:hypothetical protein n=1 Tax=Cellulophaga phage phiSM TaxID=756280 RepID=UPI0002B791C0|nr:hypothetical protein CEPG_00004 [Cellulophaga phage phiSM]AGF91163.1 hypothetical protein CHPG_00011 [Cellulophaga phage phi3:1]AGF91667.1 hypothetical protein CDPG_00063 [Cellulophaga phage phi47:1]AGO47736.1 structural protein [Cellulophaga phage phi3ST:2]AGO49244.1 structural protein [Cellulophaga phage phi38:2]AGH07752.1 hypothetical protein CEPG_00004 [Cellulophaga phage phiSM]